MLVDRLRAPFARTRFAVAVCTAVAVLTGGVSHAAAPRPATGRAAVAAYSVSAGPNYSRSRTLSAYHRLDCSSTNPYWHADGCNLTIDTRTSGCLWESQTTEPVPVPSDCHVIINGPIAWHPTSSFCTLYGPANGLTVSYMAGSGVASYLSPITFEATAFLTPSAPQTDDTRTRSYVLKVLAGHSPATAGPSPGVSTGSIYEVFVVDFAVGVSDYCPNADNDTNSVGNVRDARADVVAQDNATTGFLKAEVLAN